MDERDDAGHPRRDAAEHPARRGPRVPDVWRGRRAGPAPAGRAALTSPERMTCHRKTSNGARRLRRPTRPSSTPRRVRTTCRPCPSRRTTPTPSSSTRAWATPPSAGRSRGRWRPTRPTRPTSTSPYATSSSTTRTTIGEALLATLCYLVVGWWFVVLLCFGVAWLLFGVLC